MFYSATRTSFAHVHRPAVQSEEGIRVRRGADRKEIEKLAYSYWIAGGRREGTALSDWLQAERILSDR